MLMLPLITLKRSLKLLTTILIVVKVGFIVYGRNLNISDIRDAVMKLA